MIPTSHRLSFAILWLTIFVSMLGVGAIAPFLPLYARQMGASGVVMGLIFSSFSLARALTMPSVGVISDRRGRKPFLLLGLLGSAATALALIWAASPLELVLNRVFQGVFAAMVMPVAMALVADVAPDGGEGRIFGQFNSALLLGFGAGPLIGGVLYDHWGFESNFIFMALLSLVSLGMVAVWIKESPEPKSKREANGKKGQLGLMKDPRLLAIFLSRTGGAMGMGCFITFLPVICADMGLPNSYVGILLAVNVVVMSMCQYPSGRLADRLPRVPLAGISQALSAVCKVGLPMVAGFEGLLVLVIVEGAFSGMALPALTALTVSRGKKLGAGMGMVMSFYGLGLSAGVFLGPVLGGALADMSGMAGPFWLSGAAGVAGALCLFLVRKGKAQPEPAP